MIKILFLSIITIFIINSCSDKSDNNQVKIDETEKLNNLLENR